MWRLLLVPLLAAPAFSAGWTEYRSGPFHVISDAGDRAARDRLTELEQLRHTLGVELGKDDLQTVWPIQLVVFGTQKDYAPYALSQPFVDGGSSTLASWNSTLPLPHDFLRALTRLLIEDNAGRMPEAMEGALCDLFSTIQVNATRVSIGGPPAQGELPPERIRAWAKVQMLATQPDFSGRLHVFLNNLQQGADEGVSARNSFDLTKAELESRVDAYLKAGNFTPEPVSGLTIDPNHDFVETQVPQSAIDTLLAELKAQGKEFPPDSPRGLFAKGTRGALEQAAKGNPKWAEPHVKLAALETDAAAKIKELKAAATLEPRNSAYWEELAKAESAADHYADADKSWMLAERSATNESERARVHKARIDMDEQRAAFEIAERKRLEAERAAELQHIKDSAAAEVHAAEAAANARMGGLKPGEKPVAWWNDADGQKLSATLTRVDCLAESLRLTLQPPTGAAVKLLIRDPNNLAVKGANQAEFACGAQKPARKINLVHNGKPDAKMGTAGDILSVEFP
ncbi:MAG TPA: hypothetical protein VH639_02680 [Bryobacteraceae bacterium]|jgi:hypothetical protein